MKKYNHSRSYGSRIINWRTLVMSISILACLVLANYGNEDKVYVAEIPQQEAFLVPVVVEPKPTIEDKIKQYFPRSWPKFIQIAHAESRMDPEAVGYNCYYYHGVATTTKIKGGSRACKPKDRPLAHSLDCGLMQLNTKAKECPDEDLDTHLARAAELSKTQGPCGWFGYEHYRKECARK